MADAELDAVMQDLQNHLKNARIDVSNLSSIAKKGDDKLVEKFMSESVFVRVEGQNRLELTENKTEVLASQLYIACFWGFRDVVKGILQLSHKQNVDVNVNAQNKGTRWTPLHAATFQEHGPIVMQLLACGAEPDIADSEGRTAKDFASASDKIWGHFAAVGLKRTPKSQLVDMGIIKKVYADTPELVSGKSNSPRTPGQAIRMAAYSRPESAYAYSSDPFLNAAAGGDVLANDEEALSRQTGPQFSVYK